MVVVIIGNIITLVSNLLIILVILDSVLSFFLNPYHSFRVAMDRIVQPLLAPIRRVVPLVGMLDLSPLIFIILVEILSSVLVRLLYAL
jgi:YggT family protein